MSSTLAVCVFLGTPTPLFAYAPRALAFTPDYDLTELRAYDPLFRDFARETWAPPTKPAWERNDLDVDPYFMRSQSFGGPIATADATAGDGRTTFVESPGRLRLQVPGVDRSLEIAQPLRPLFEVDDYLFLQVTDRRVFAGRFADQDLDASEGLFFVDKQYVYAELARAGERRPVPVFFLPLAGRWTGKVEHVAVEPFTTLALKNDGDDVVTIDLATIRQLARGLHNQVQLATLMALKHDPSVTPSMAANAPFKLPPRGSTAMFGTFFTGVDLDKPDRGITPVPGGTSAAPLTLLPRANALLLSPDVWDRLLRVALITSNVWMLGTALQYTRLRPRMLERRAYMENPTGQNVSPPSRSTGYRIRRAIRENVDVFSTGLSILATAPDTIVGYALEYAADRSGFKFARNGWLRKALNHTFIFTREQNEDINVNWKAFYLGVVILGTIDTTGVALQLLWATPLIMPWVAALISDRQHARAVEQFSGANVNTNQFVTSEIMRNLSGHFVQGAYGYAQDQRNAMIEVVRPQVERRYQLMGKNPQAPEHKLAFMTEINRRVEQLLVQRELPPMKEFIASSPSLARAFAALLGYRVDRAKLKASPDYDPDSKYEPEFLLEYARHGVSIGAIKRARAAVDREARSFPADRDLAASEVILGEMQRRYSALWEMAKDPRNAEVIARESYNVKKIMTFLTQTGVVTDGLKYMDLWTPEDPAPLRRLIAIKREVRANVGPSSRARLFKLVGDRARAESPELGRAFATYAGKGRTFESQLARIEADYRDGILGAAVRNPRAAQLAGQAFRQAMFGLVEDRPDYLRPDEEDIVTYGADARREAERRLAALPKRLDFDAADLELETLRVIKEKVDAREEEKKFAAWAPEKPDLVARLQIHAAERAALRATQARLGSDFDPSPGGTPLDDPRVEPIYREAYRRALAKRVGLHAIEGDAYDAEVRDLAAVEDAMKTVGDRWALRVHPPGSRREDFLGAELDRELAATPDARARYRNLRRRGVDVRERLRLRRAEIAVNEQARQFAEDKIDADSTDNPGWITYLKSLSSEERVRFLSHQYAESYLDKYAELTVGSAELVPHTSPAQPGYFQRVRQAELLQTGRPLARALTTLLRVAESPFDSTSLRVGAKAFVKRRVPFAQDVMSDTYQRVKRFAVFVGLTWSVQWYLWGVHFDTPTMLLFFWTGGLTAVAHYWVDRMLVNAGSPPMGGTWTKVKYAVLINVLTYPSYIPFFLLEEDWRAFWTTRIAQPFTEAALAVAQTCQNWLTTIF